MKKVFTSLALLAALCPTAMQAQYAIYPVPQQQVAGSTTASFTTKVTLVVETGIDDVTKSRAQQVLREAGLTVTLSDSPSATTSNVYLGINGSNGVAEQKATACQLKRDVFSQANKYDRHLLHLFGEGSSAQVVILGENTDATFYGLASLEQIFDQGTANLKSTTLYDYADEKSRGIVEGYYGYPYTAAVKQDLMRFMMRHKMNTYMYGAKSDPYHSQYWKDAYPTTLTAEQEKNGWLSQSMVKDITSTATQCKVHFIWAIHPGNAFLNSDTAIDDIMAKFDKMHQLGVRQFAVFVDDVSIPSTDADLKKNADRLTTLQHAIENKWNKSFTTAADTVRPLHFVPQIYCRTFASSQDLYNRFFTALSTTPSNVTIYTTGYNVWAVPNSNDFNMPANLLGRSVAWWWNYPCNDNADSQIYPMDMYSNFYDMPSVTNTATLPATISGHYGIVSNPMQQGEVAKTAIFSVADYAWNTDGFDNIQSWNASYRAVLPGNEPAQQAYQFLANYLRWNDPTEFATMMNNYKQQGNSAELIDRLEQIRSNCDVMIALKDSPKEGEALLYKDLSPWLLKLRAMSDVTIQLLRTAANADATIESRWPDYIQALNIVNGLSTEEAYKAYALEGMGSGISVSVRPAAPSQRTFMPFVEYMKDHTLTIPQAAKPTRPTFVSNNPEATGNVSGSTYYYITQSRPVTLAKGEWMGIQLVEPTLLQKMVVSDTLLTNHSVVYSDNGKQWTRLTESTTVPSTYVRYVGVVNDNDAPESVRFVSGSIKLYVPSKVVVSQATVPTNPGFYESHTEKYMYDGDYTTYTCIKRNQANNDAYTLKLNKKQPIYKVRIGMGTTNGDYMNHGRVQISSDGTTWTDLKIKGSNTVDYTLSDSHVVTISSECTLCDFDGAAQEAQYVRLLLNEANTSKWIRLYEIEVNGADAFTRATLQNSLSMGYPQATDGQASTSTAGALSSGNRGELTYYLNNYALLQGLTLYVNPATFTSAVQVERTSDFATWQPIQPTGTDGVLKLALTDVETPSQATLALRFSWEGAQAPAIHEIVEQPIADALPTVTQIDRIETDGTHAAEAQLSWANGLLTIQSAAAISQVDAYTLNGSQLFTYKASAAKTIQLPLRPLQSDPVIVRVRLANGQSQSFKLR